MKQLFAILILFTVCFGYSQNDNPYSKFGYKGNTIKTPQERMNYMLIIPNQDTISVVSKIGIEPKEEKYYLFNKENNIVYQGNLDIEKTSRFFAVDPLSKDYPHNSPYAFSENDVIRAIELEGLEKLIVSNINKEDRTATLTIKKTALMVKEGIDNVPQHGKFSSKSLNSLFARGNTNIYFQGLPQNGIESSFTKSMWKKNRLKNDVYKVRVEYDVNMKFVSADEANKLLRKDPALYSKVSLSNSKTKFSSSMTGGKARSGGYRNTILLNPTFFGEKPTSPMGEVDGKVYPNATEILGHELGIHNMAGQLHQKNPKTGKAVYPSKGLGANSAGNVYPLKTETQQIIKQNNKNTIIKE